MIEKLTKGLEENTVNELNNKADMLSPKGQRLLKEQLGEQQPKLSKLAKKQRPAKIMAMIEEILKKYTRKDLRPAKEKVVRDIAVLQLSKDGAKVIAEHQSVQAAHRATSISDSSICYCCHNYAKPGTHKGFQAAGGFKWAYKRDWAAPAQEEAKAE